MGSIAQNRLSGLWSKPKNGLPLIDYTCHLQRVLTILNLQAADCRKSFMMFLGHSLLSRSVLMYFSSTFKVRFYQNQMSFSQQLKGSHYISWAYLNLPETAWKALFQRVQQGFVLLANQMGVVYAHFMNKTNIVAVLVSCWMFQQEKSFTFWNCRALKSSHCRYSRRVHWGHYWAVHHRGFSLCSFQTVASIPIVLDLHKTKGLQFGASKMNEVITHWKGINVLNSQLWHLRERTPACSGSVKIDFVDIMLTLLTLFCSAQIQTWSHPNNIPGILRV